VVLFTKRQWKEKRTKIVEVRRVKDETLVEFGFPKYIIKTKAPIKFFVSMEYSDALRIYPFSDKGELLSAENFEKPYEVRQIM
jgi:hypothetical protein